MLMYLYFFNSTIYLGGFLYFWLYFDGTLRRSCSATDSFGGVLRDVFVIYTLLYNRVDDGRVFE